MSYSPNVALPTALFSQDQSEQLSALRSLKNDIVGHAQKKEKWIEAGILEPLVKILNTSRAAVRPSRRDSRGYTQSSPRSLTGDEAVRWQALQILASFSNGGSAFLAPMHAAGALSAVLSNIPTWDNPPQVVIAALRATINIAEVTVLGLPGLAKDLADIANVVFVAPLLEALRLILTTPVTSHACQTQRNLVAKLISLLCREESHQRVLADAGLLDALATNLASVVVARGFVVPGAEAIARTEGISDLFPDPAAAGTDVTAIFEALAAIINDSRWRAAALIYAPAILTVFPSLGPPRRSRAIKACADALGRAGLSSVADKDLGVMDCFLPLVPEYQSRNTTASHFPPLGSSPTQDTQSSARMPSYRWISSPMTWRAEDYDFQSAETEVEEAESPLIPWLIYTARSTEGMERIMAASVVTSLFKAGFTNKTSRAYMGRLIVPVLLQALEDMGPTSSNAEAAFTDVHVAANRSIVERSLAVLAKLVVDSDFLQSCAFDCSAVKIISAYLKGAYEPLERPSRSWSPTPSHEKPVEREIGFPTSRLGSQCEPSLLSHRIRMRETALKAVAALAGKDEYGKAFVDQELVPYIVESLSAWPTKPVKDQPKSPKFVLAGQTGAVFDPAYGVNPIPVVVAACHALRTLSRSVSILRTTLQDSGVATPAFRLLLHPDIEVQIAASGLMCNLVTTVSPMRDRLDTLGVMRRLCHHTRSQNPVLRLNALWALKHWVDGASLSQKKDCIDELTPGWLIRLIRDDTEDMALYKRTAKNEKQAAGGMDEDVDMGQAGDETRASASAFLEDPSPPTHPAGNQRQTRRLRQAGERVAGLRELELSPVRKVRHDDLAIQEQGLHFLRNLMGPVHSAANSAKDHAEMIDHLFSVLNQDQFFQIIHSKLQLRILHPFERRYPGSHQESRVLYPQPRIVAAVVYILVHLAASLPRHRQILISQTDILTDLGKHFTSKDKEVRVALCHLITNLTWRDDVDDEESSAARAGEIMKLGLLKRLEILESADTELDVRERAKAAIWQINKPREF
ncbi:hypothetical protein M406DRAFT_277069 [Cryphonectria parasitica EP155]|uniref:Armadillo repeat-containing protein 8 n=1 Tax=Cryphonectria parasitica (strain ATCC 38755 / EP155) TaxID=660469 RepID=A0A9P4Y3F7_CRYP1|nr:uncharacterized protein M406DRAFT_277069 [Cryphonectria parasitica EP155]KAF3766239.1 hypothetical protein M406DRAFT_277069 [Cryphonectria parasitica EP155]